MTCHLIMMFHQNHKNVENETHIHDTINSMHLKKIDRVNFHLIPMSLLNFNCFLTCFNNFFFFVHVS